MLLYLEVLWNLIGIISNSILNANSAKKLAVGAGLPKKFIKGPSFNFWSFNKAKHLPLLSHRKDFFAPISPFGAYLPLLDLTFCIIISINLLLDFLYKESGSRLSLLIIIGPNSQFP